MLKFDLGEFFLGTKNIRYNSKIVSWDFKPPPLFPEKRMHQRIFFGRWPNNVKFRASDFYCLQTGLTKYKKKTIG